MKEIKLEKEGLIPVNINDIDFEVDTMNLDHIEALINFSIKYGEKIDVKMGKRLINTCKELIDTVLGEGSYDRLFTEPSLKAYILCFELINVFGLGLTDLYSKTLKDTALKVDKVTQELNDIVEQVDKIEAVKSKYGIKQAGSAETIIR